ncbi:polysaccharide deacetylase family protein [Pontibacter sp. HSC-14F20]|uniref:polysaccharide deacetylase family protein n=1 Tax=Pontibacter sp. HSC-14F20 TaxID=2864136 RepID=UPI001C7323CE|nr:polysaccharide deacetylase family protein [Pontibacter sp. HSC-14F20]MBX0333250.1 polysaccharide deacetylase family protein [Pontibacter sp. HSC-14F20]
MIKDKPIFTISLDFELYWGIFDKVPLAERKLYFANTRRVIPEMLTLFKQQQVHVTWATVGMLFAEDWKDWTTTTPFVQPSYHNGRLSAYRLNEEYGHDDSLRYSFFAPALVEQIHQTPYQEMATHTYAHYYCQEVGQTLEQFRHDLQAAQSIATRRGMKLESLVFPRNQFNKDYLRVCHEEGIRAVRSNPVDWFWEHTVEDKLSKRIFRTLDAYLPLSNKTSFPLSSLKLEDGFPLAIPASRFLRPVDGKREVLNKLRLHRILSEMTVAASRKECYHLWWHPHNFGNYPERSMADLRVIINHYNKLQEQYGMQSMSMQEIYEYISYKPVHSF